MTSPDLAFPDPGSGSPTLPDLGSPPGPGAGGAKPATTKDTKAKGAKAKGAKGKAAGGDDTPKKSKKKLVIVAVVVLLAVGYVAKGKLLKAHYKPGQPVPLGTIDTLDQLTVNLSDGHMAQATIALQLTTVANQKEITADMPRFEDAAITVLGAETYPSLLTTAGKTAVKTEILHRCQQIVGTVDGAAQQIVAVYFTGFVVQ